MIRFDSAREREAHRRAWTPPGRCGSCRWWSSRVAERGEVRECAEGPERVTKPADDGCGRWTAIG